MERPARSYETGAFTRWIRRLGVALTAATALAVILLYRTLPETVPTHFNFAGQPDAWGPRSSIWVLVGILTVVIAGMTWLSFHPRAFNYPGVVTEHNAQALYRAGEQMIVWLTASCAVLYFGTTASVLFSFNSGVIVLVGVIGMVASLVAGLIRLFRA